MEVEAAAEAAVELVACLVAVASAEEVAAGRVTGWEGAVTGGSQGSGGPGSSLGRQH